MICRGCELEIFGVLLIGDLRVMDMSEFDVIDSCHNRGAGINTIYILNSLYCSSKATAV